MRLHFASEVVLEFVCQRFPNILKVGAHIAADKARIDFEWNQTISSFILSLQQDTQNIIDPNQEIISAFSDEANERKYWKINECSQVPSILNAQEEWVPFGLKELIQAKEGSALKFICHSLNKLLLMIKLLSYNSTMIKPMTTLL